MEVKLHGDFRSRRLKNTTDELRQQDATLRQLLVEACGRFGLVVAGYSGRDSSIMDTLDEATSRPGSFPAGLFWLHRGDDPGFRALTRCSPTPPPAASRRRSSASRTSMKRFATRSG